MVRLPIYDKHDHGAGACTREELCVREPPLPPLLSHRPQATALAAANAQLADMQRRAIEAEEAAAQLR